MSNNYTTNTSKTGNLMLRFNLERRLRWHGLSVAPLEDRQEEQLNALLKNNLFDRDMPHSVKQLAKEYRDGILCVLDSSLKPSENLIGCVAFLPLSQYGVRVVETDNLDGGSLDEEVLAMDFKLGQALYLWAAVATGRAMQALPLIEYYVNSTALAKKRVFSRASTQAGLQSLLRLGFQPFNHDLASEGSMLSLSLVEEGGAS